MTAGPEAPPTLFAWEARHRFRWTLFGFVFLSAAVHGATFFLFQISVPARVTVPPPAPEVSLLLPTSPENRLLLRRIEAENPALVAMATSLQPPGLLDLKYRASYQTVRTRPRTVAEEVAVVRFPAPKDPLSIIRSGSLAGSLAGAAPPPLPTRIAFSPEIQARAPQAAPSREFNPHAAAPLEPAKFLIGVTDRGEVRFVFLQRSSGELELDRQGAARLTELNFQPGTGPIAWGFATIAWGDDAYGENPQPQ